MNKEKRRLNPYLASLISFLLVIIVGSVLLCCPFTHRNGQWGNYIDELFTATSATCVTGASTYKEGFANTMNFWGQLITLILIEIGGLGLITILTFFISLFNPKISFKNKVFLSQVVNSESISQVNKFVIKIALISLSFQLIGFALGLPVFMKMYEGNIREALWNSLFHSVSSFNNAGFDLFNGTTSLIGGLSKPLQDGVQIPANSFLYYYFCTYIMFLIIAGGISFLVIIDSLFSRKKINQWKSFTKLVFVLTAAYILLGFISLMITENFLNPGEKMHWFDALFQSVTCRTCGFITYEQDKLTLFGKLFSSILMTIGGSPLGTAGGVKTTTFFLVFYSIGSYIKENRVHVFRREYSKDLVVKASSLLIVFITITILSFVLIYYFEYSTRDKFAEVGLTSSFASLLLYESFSCISTTGVFVGVEPFLTVGSKIVLCIIMLIGRLGHMTFFALGENKNDINNKNHYKLVQEDFIIG